MTFIIVYSTDIIYIYVIYNIIMYIVYVCTGYSSMTKTETSNRKEVVNKETISYYFKPYI